MRPGCQFKTFKGTGAEPKLILAVVAIFSALSACSKPDPTFILGETQQSLLVSPDIIQTPRKLDVLLVVDNSGSMETSQNHLAQTFPSFIQKFIQKQYDFRIAVTTTEAYLTQLYPNSTTFRNFSRLRQTSAGETFLTRNTPNIVSKFMEMALIGTEGSGDERAHWSIKATLERAENQSFRRSDAYLAIIILSDEDDFSHWGTTLIEDYNSPALLPASYFKNFLDQYAGVDNYSVYSISILDEACRQQLLNSFAGRKIGQRYHELVALSGGINVSLCSDFASNLQLISDTIVSKTPPTTVYTLLQEPRVETITVKINGETIANDEQNGWIYDPNTRTIQLNGRASQLIEEGGRIEIFFIPRDPFAG